MSKIWRNKKGSNGCPGCPFVEKRMKWAGNGRSYTTHFTIKIN
ncbi:MAG: hypothetical protein R3D55_02365 [Chloroflexota bacterium]